MGPTLENALLILAAYLVGSIPFGFLVSKLIAHKDIRGMGSGNIGATNVGRVLGTRWGLVVLIADALKGIVAVFLLPRLVATDTVSLAQMGALCGLAAVVGHMFPCWLKFRGGKGVATSLGAAAVLAPFATLVAIGIFVLTFLISRIVAISSLLGVCGFAAWQLIEWGRGNLSGGSKWSVLAFSAIVPLLIVVRHRSNIGRLIRGEEPRYRSATSSKQ